ncbi:MAG: succinate dehydrogenase cytochrome b subunit [Vicinamibacterales bacterium]
MSSRPFASSVGTKLLVGITGLFLFIYLLVHIAGNLVVFAGPDTFNLYAGALSANPIIIVIEIVLLTAFLTHAVRAVAMTLRNRGARPVAYVVKKPAGGKSRKSFASTTMIVSGVWLLVFVVLHVYGFKFAPAPMTADGHRDLYALEMGYFSNPALVAFYVLTMGIVGMHLFHGISSAFQSLGLDHPVWTPRILMFGKVAASLIAALFILIALWAFVTGGVQA